MIKKHLSFLLLLLPALCWAQTYSGGFFLNSQAKVDSAVQVLRDGGYTAISGGLWIGTQEENAPHVERVVIKDLSGFEMLTKIGWLKIQNTDSLQSLHGLHHIDSIGNGIFWITNNPHLESIAALGNANFYNLGSSYFTELRIQDNPRLKSLDGLEGVTKVGGWVRIGELYHDDEPYQLEDLRGLRNLMYVGEMLLITYYKGSTLKGLENIKLEDYLTIYDCPNLSDISALSQWDTIGKMSLGNCPELKDLSPLDGLVLSGDKWVRIEHCPKIGRLPKLKFTDNEAPWIYLEDLPSLHDISALHPVTHIPYRLEIIDCDALEYFELPNWQEGNGLIIEDNDSLDSFAFPQLKRVALTVNNNAQLKHLRGSDRLTRLIGIGARDNTALEEISGFNAVDTISSIRLFGNPNIKTFTGFNNLKAALGRGIQIYWNNHIDSFTAFPNIEYVDGEFYIGGSGFSSIPPFDKLREVTRNILIAQATDLKALRGFSNLKKVGNFGMQVFSNDKLETISICQSLDSILVAEGSSTAGLSVVSNASLKYFGGFDSIRHLQSELWLEGSTALEQAPALCHIRRNLGGWPDIRLRDNAAGFNTLDEVEAHCEELTGAEEAVPTLPFEAYPNPFVEELYVTAPAGSYRYRLLDVFGRLVRQGPLPQAGSLRLSGLATGVYLLSVLDEKGQVVWVEKVVRG